MVFLEEKVNDFVNKLLGFGGQDSLVLKYFYLGKLQSILTNLEYLSLTEKDLESFQSKYTLKTIELKVVKALEDLLSVKISSLVSNLKSTSDSVSIKNSVRILVSNEEEATNRFLDNENAYALIYRLTSDLVKSEMAQIKALGNIMTIVTGQGPYKSIGGVSSPVVALLKDSACVKCRDLYVDNDGGPIVWSVSNLLRFKNLDHDKCIKKVQIFIDPLNKAVDPGSLGSTVKPPGAAKAAGKAVSPAVKNSMSPGSIAGAPAPGNVKTKGGPKIKYEYWGKDGSPPTNSNWEKSPGGAWRRPVGSGSGTRKKEDVAEEIKSKEEIVESAKNWGASNEASNKSKVLNHLSEGKIANVHRIGSEVGDNAGINASFRIAIDGNGRGIMKPPQVQDADMRAGRKFTEGCGTVDPKNQPKNEESAFKLFSFFGLNHCPPTTVRNVLGTEHSVQQWQEGSNPIIDGFRQKYNGMMNFINSSKTPINRRKQLEEIAVMDIVMNSNDRHLGNLVMSEDGEKISAIDHGVSFGTGMMGYKNVPHLLMHNEGMKLKVPDHIAKKLENTSLTDLKTALNNQEDWVAGQTFLRGQYILHLQKTEGHLNYKHFDTDIVSTKGVVSPYENLNNTSIFDFYKREEKRDLTHQKFEDFALDFIDSAKSDPSHPHHEDAKELDRMGVFMEAGFNQDPLYRASGRHKEYENKIRAERDSFTSVDDSEFEFVEEKDSDEFELTESDFLTRS